jgi:aldehyde dehydrogenase (NAD+)
MHERLGIFVDGKWVPAAGGTTYTVINPTTEDRFGSFSVGDASDVDRAVCSADRALRASSWPSTSLEERCSMVARLSKLLSERAEDLARLGAQTVGAPIRAGLHLGGSISLIEMFLSSARSIEFEYLREDAAGHSLVTRRPVGVVAGILPWNTPLRSEVKKTVPALLAGCTVVLKPSLEGAFSAFEFAELCREAGVPPGVVNVVPGDGATGQALVTHPLINKIAFTGSTATGARIAATAGPAFKRMQLELGGKSAAVLLPDFDLDLTIQNLVRGNWGNSGQLCVALSRVLVPRNRAAEVLETLAFEAGRQVLGDPLSPATTMGPVVTSQHRDRVQAYIRAGMDQGARLVTGKPELGIDRGWFVAPAVFGGVEPDMTIAQEEIFGPVVSVIEYDTVDDAVAIANASPYGLHGAVFGQDASEALRVARRLETGSAAVNGFYLAPSAPFGGVKQSGIGREHGPEGFDSFLEYVSYSIQSSLAARLAADGVSWKA